MSKVNYWKGLFLTLIVIIMIILVLYGIRLTSEQSTLTAPFQRGVDRGTWKNLYGDKLDMANTISPIISEICQELCPFPSENENEWGSLSGELIYKREPVKDCIHNEGNVYYCRCHRWGWQEEDWRLEGLEYEEDGLYLKVIEDKPLEELFGRKVYSCINEDELLIPYYDKRLAEMEIGETKLMVYE